MKVLISLADNNLQARRRNQISSEPPENLECYIWQFSEEDPFTDVQPQEIWVQCGFWHCQHTQCSWTECHSIIIYSSEHKIPGKKSINSPMEDKSITVLWSKAIHNNDQADGRSFARNFEGISISCYWIPQLHVRWAARESWCSSREELEGVNSK